MGVTCYPVPTSAIDDFHWEDKQRNKCGGDEIKHSSSRIDSLRTQDLSADKGYLEQITELCAVQLIFCQGLISLHKFLFRGFVNSREPLPKTTEVH